MNFLISLAKKIPFLQRLNRRVKSLIDRIPIVTPSIRPPFKLVVYPPINDDTELIDICYKIQYFLPTHLIERVSLSVIRPISIDSIELIIPDYVKADAIPVNSFEWIKLNQKMRYQQRLIQADYILVWDENNLKGNPLISMLERKVCQLDRHMRIWDGWNWVNLGHKLDATEETITPANAQIRFNQYIESLPKYKKAYVFGTGPSLDLAYQFDFSDGYRIVCNTIVKNLRLLEHISPHFIVAADAIYHFGNNKHANQFRCDLENALEISQSVFLTADFFAYLIKYHHPRIFLRTIPIRTDLDGIFLDMKNTLAYTNLPNILNSLLLPLGTSLANEVNLLGFDGRASNDTLFWQNSGANSYEELKPTIMAAHPGFFKGINYEEYARLQGESAEQVMALGEQMGKKYYCLNQTFIPALQKRLHQNAVR